MLRLRLLKNEEKLIFNIQLLKHCEKKMLVENEKILVVVKENLLRKKNKPK